MGRLFLSREEVIELTGYQKPGYMIARLKLYGVRFFVAADGYPRVPRSEIEGGDDRGRRRRPNFDALAKGG